MTRRPGKLMVTASCFLIGQAIAVSGDWFSQSRSRGPLWPAGWVNSWNRGHYFLLSGFFLGHWSSSCLYLIGSASLDCIAECDLRLVELGAVLWNRNYFRFRFWLLKSYGSGSGSGSGSNFWKVMVPVPVPVPTFEKLTVPVPVPVPAPYLDHKKQI